MGEAVVDFQRLIERTDRFIKTVQGEQRDTLIAPCPFITGIIFKGPVEEDNGFTKPVKVHQGDSLANRCFGMFWI